MDYLYLDVALFLIIYFIFSESCRHHSGEPVFHDAYKGWSCCKKKCTDFTEFLNIPVPVFKL